MELSPRAPEVHQQEQNFFQLIILFNRLRPHEEDLNADFFCLEGRA